MSLQEFGLLALSQLLAFVAMTFGILGQYGASVAYRGCSKHRFAPADSLFQINSRSTMARTLLHDIPVHVRFKLAGLWSALMFCYIYGDYFGLYVPGKLKGMLAGEGPIGPVSESTGYCSADAGGAWPYDCGDAASSVALVSRA
jgi:hypothetical protein